MPEAPWIRPLLGFGRVPFVALLVLLTALFGRWALDSRLERSNESMTARTPEQQQVYDRMIVAFGQDEILIVGLHDENLLERSGLERLRSVAQEIAAIDGVQSVLSLTDAVEIVPGDFGATEQPAVRFGEDQTRQELEAVLDRNPEWTGLLLSEDRRTAGILVEIEDRPGDDLYRSYVVDSLRAIKRRLADEGAEAHVTGITVQKLDTTRFVARDQRVVLPVAVIVLAIALYLVTRRITGVVLPLGVTGVTLIWTLGIHSALGFQLNVITSLLPPVVMVLSIATAIHLYQEWVLLGPNERDPRRLSEAVVGALAVPCTLTVVTTAMGLGSLAVSDVPAVREFALFGALGVLISLLLNLTLMPIVLTWLRPPGRRLHVDSKVGPMLDRIADLTVHRPRTILAVTLAISVVALVGLSKVRNNTDLVRFLRPDAELFRDTMWIDEELVGANALELVIDRVDGEPLTDPDDLQRIARFDNEIASMISITNVLAITDVLERVHQAELDLEQPQLPDTVDDVLYAYDLLDESDRSTDVRRLLTADRKQTRLSVRMHSVGTADSQDVIDLIMLRADELLGDSLRLVPTGEFYMVTVGSNRLVADQLLSFGLALIAVFLTLSLVFRSVVMLFAAIWPNIIPILWGGGLMGWLGIDLSTATAMVASVVIGIAVDDTIHYLDRFRKEHRGDVHAAVRTTTRTTGRVLMIASLVLAFGFWVGALGSFLPTVYFSLISGGAILTALFCDLLVLPACLVLARPRPRRIDS